MKRALVAGAGGFIGHHLVKYLKGQGYWVRGYDIKRPQYEETMADEFLLGDLRYYENAVAAVKDVDEVYQLAADMGGIGYINSIDAPIMRNNLYINLNMLDAALNAPVTSFTFTSSACVYPKYKQEQADVIGLVEDDVMPADPDHGYGWEKLTMEKLCEYYRKDHELKTHIARLHNVYGPLGTYDGGREKAPAALCRKVSQAEKNGTIEVWGDGQQTRSFMFVNDCVRGLHMLAQSDIACPLNIGTEELVSINSMLLTIQTIASKPNLKVTHNLDAIQGVRGRNSDNTKVKAMLGWEPEVKLFDGLKETYSWINQQCLKAKLSVAE